MVARRNNDEPTGDDIPLFEESQINLGEETFDTETLYPCSKCGLPLEYAGRGRKPTVCKRGEGCRANEGSVTARRTSGDVEKIRQGMLELYLTVGIGVNFFDQFDGMVVAQNAPKLADSWAALAEKDPKVRKALMKMLTGTSWSAVLIAHAMVAVPIMQHHKLIPQLVEAKADGQ